MTANSNRYGFPSESRTVTDPAELAEAAESITDHGVLPAVDLAALASRHLSGPHEDLSR